MFQVYEMTLSEIFEVLNHQSEENYTYIKNLIDNMAKKLISRILNCLMKKQ